MGEFEVIVRVIYIKKITFLGFWRKSLVAVQMRKQKMRLRLFVLTVVAIVAVLALTLLRDCGDRRE